ncbi:hypothetical protein BBP40_011781 [Aspergillus hancockii]|nr:hypothetical protein BBP40_011781 [Aspergillus hancockii]
MSSRFSNMTESLNSNPLVRMQRRRISSGRFQLRHSEPTLSALLKKHSVLLLARMSQLKEALRLGAQDIVHWALQLHARVGTSGHKAKPLVIWELVLSQPFFPATWNIWVLPNPVSTWGNMELLQVGGEDNRDEFPHVTLQTCQPFDGKEKSILFGELATLISVRQNRASQPKVEDEDEQETLFDRLYEL